MEINEKEFSPQESLQLIQTMINKTKDSVADDSFYFLLWGWMTFVCCITQFTLKVYFDYPNHYFVWWLMMPVGGVTSGIYGARQSKSKKVKSFVDESLDFVWIALGFAFIVLIVINVRTLGWEHAFTYYILLYGIGTFISGKLLRFRPLVIGGLINFVLSAISVSYSFDYQILIGGLAILTSYIIPGHLLRLRYLKTKQQ
jgi:hypothetical protein